MPVCASLACGLGKFILRRADCEELACGEGGRVHPELSASPSSQESLRRLPWGTCVSADQGRDFAKFFWVLLLVSASARQSRAQ